MNSKLSKALGLGLFTSVISVAAFAEPPVQPGETLESLSKAKISTKVNGQEASLESLVNSGQIRLVDPRTAAPQPVMPDTQMPNDPAMAQAPNHSGTVSPQPPVTEAGMNESEVPANLVEPATESEVEASTSMTTPQQQPTLEEQQAAVPAMSEEQQQAAIASEQPMPEAQQQAAVTEADVSNEQTEIAAQSDAEPVLMEEPLNAAPEVPAAVELEQ
ncbi:hypothetical protein EVX74_014705 [Acinetobacter lwoffii]|jgi:hypothetical protein|uniref:Uncharacterized protein n=1 Tax=Acinetobacter lwoffii TaxID=28090 RepID=A0AAJ4TTS3_ACILW|nr:MULTISPECIES: hypothetical protein [Acinetobacter]ENU63933.1 hypothetical protein F980_00398 [Acinetobacter lwoffii NIPH 715]MCU4421774.1 hypothetical protein [Acinetobacter lwoffii]QJB47513.1 hypothetical protein HGD77_01415 [Acinetobacter sp. NEB149]QXR07287.1 hypothetical protein EVX74_014705 [Acinetobacter lwoffii]